MTIPAPNLDDRRYPDLIRELRRLAADYTPEWQSPQTVDADQLGLSPSGVDLNDPDPGVTLMQLHAWLVDQLLYRLNRVPNRLYVMFLRLLGVELRPAQPATTELTFTLARDDVAGAWVPRGTQVAASGPDGPIVFETDQAAYVLGATLAHVASTEQPGTTTHTTANDTPHQTFAPFGPRARQGSALLLGLACSVPLPDHDIDLTLAVDTPRDHPEAHCDIDLRRLPLPAELTWQYWDGRDWAQLLVYRDDTRAMTRSGHIYLRSPGAGARRATLAGSEQDLFWLRCLLNTGGYDTSPRLDRVLLNTIPATQAITVTDEVLGGSDGSQHQTFDLAHHPLVHSENTEMVEDGHGHDVTVHGLRLEIDEGGGFEVWQQVDSLHASGPNDRHYRLSGGRTIVTGDGLTGRIPRYNPARPSSNVVARWYRYGGGPSGNLPTGAITELQTHVDYVAAATNLTPARGGRPAQTVDEAGAVAAALLRTRDLAVTTDGFEHLALRTPTVALARAKALPLRTPALPDVDVPGAVTVIVVPEGNPGDTAPTPTPATVHAVCAHLNRHRLLTTEVHVIGPTYVTVEVTVRATAAPDADPAEIAGNVHRALGRYLHPLTGGRDGRGWEFGGTVYYSDLYRQVLDADPGLARIDPSGLEVRIDGEVQPPCQDMPIPPTALVCSHDHHVTIGYDRAEP